MAIGEPGLPREFLWRKETIRITAVLRTWKDTGPCTHGSPEKYVRKHWYEVETVPWQDEDLLRPASPSPERQKKEPGGGCSVFQGRKRRRQADQRRADEMVGPWIWTSSKTREEMR
jgi:hypothetical protein